jgi:tRNA G18 (ribose-2'-O)-methylase SpoU
LIKDTRNITDFYKYWDHDAIVADLDSKRNQFVVAVERINGDYNWSTVIRNCNAFLARKVYRSGKRQYDKRGTVGTHHYEHVDYIDNIISLIDKYRVEGYRIVAIDNVGEAQDIRSYQWEPRSFMLFGEEGRGLSQEAIDMCDDIVYIPQFGSVRSLNLGTASGLAMYDYACKVLTPVSV